jgi:DNA-binding transcriptional ArsR family regulator
VTPAPRKITDPRIVKAMAHPHRLAALDELRTHGPMTATECARAVGTTPSAMSYHLRELARHGFVERAASAADGRERPWRAVPGALSLEFDDPAFRPAAAAAFDSLTSTMLARVQQNLSDFAAREAAQPTSWQEVTSLSSAACWLTADEARELGALWDTFLERVRRRTAHDRPEGSRRVRAMSVVVPLDAE